jgi:predicted O-linked N-acetylglucosamine transferase (SPINDLY family)
MLFVNAADAALESFFRSVTPLFDDCQTVAMRERSLTSELEALFQQATAFLRAGRIAEAERGLQDLLTFDAASPKVLHLMGIVRLQQGREAEARDLIARALEGEPHSAQLLAAYGAIMHRLGHFEIAAESFSRTLAIQPDYPDAHYNRGVALMDLGRPREALASYDAALEIAPSDPGILLDRGLALARLDRFEEELDCYDKALAIQPDFVEALYNRAVALRHLGRLEEALASDDRALSINPRLAKSHFNRGRTLQALERNAEALQAYDQALAIQPDFIAALSNRAAVLAGLKQFAQALAAYRQIRVLDPGNPYAFGGIADVALRLCDWRETQRIAPLLEGEMDGRSIVSPFTLLGYGADAGLQRRCAENYLRHRVPPAPAAAAKRRLPNAKIKLAYLSADFHDHATAHLTAPLFECHDRDRFEIIAISFGPDDGSAMRQRLAQAFDCFHDVRRQSDSDVAAFLRRNNVDIAIDLMGLTRGERLGILSHRPCPVQAAYLGYPGTTGADFVDYIIADPVVLPFHQQDFFSEKIVHLPDCYQVNDARRADLRPRQTRAQWGLAADAFVFCCFNNSWKITPPVFAQWMRLLRAVPDSVLWLLDDNDAASANLRRAAAGHGVAPQRLVFAPHAAHDIHLARCALADLFLDTLPYNAHTTASDALRAGVPLVTQMGATFAGRVAASLLQAAGLPELITTNPADYEALALSLARNPERLASLRHRLAQGGGTLFDTDRFRRHLEAAYLEMFRIAERGEDPRSFAVPA